MWTMQSTVHSDTAVLLNKTGKIRSVLSWSFSTLNKKVDLENFDIFDVAIFSSVIIKFFF